MCSKKSTLLYSLCTSLSSKYSILGTLLSRSNIIYELVSYDGLSAWLIKYVFDQHNKYEDQDQK